MSKFKKALKAVAGLVNDVVPNEIKPIVSTALAFVPGVGPALSAAYTAADAYGGGASLGNALGQGVKSFAISQVAGAASRSLGLTTAGNDLTDALGQTKGEGIFGLGSGSSEAAQTLGATVQAAPITPVTSADLPPIDKAASGAASAAAATAPASSSLFNFDNLSKGAAIAGGIATASSLLTKPTVPTDTALSNTAASGGTAQTITDDAAAAASEEERRKRRGANSNIYTSPLGLVNPGQSAASVLLG